MIGETTEVIELTATLLLLANWMDAREALELRPNCPDLAKWESRLRHELFANPEVRAFIKTITEAL